MHAEDIDLVIVGTGYTRDAHEDLLKPIAHLAACGLSDVERNYRLKMRPGAVDKDCGIWLQGCCEASHGLSDSLLSILAVRAGELVESIFGARFGEGEKANQGLSVEAPLEMRLQSTLKPGLGLDGISLLNGNGNGITGN